MHRLEPTGPVIALGAHAALTVAPTAGVRLFTRCPPVHSVILGACKLLVEGTVRASTVLALPANTPHTLLGFEHAHAGVAYLDARHFRFEDAQRLAQRWRGFVPGRDDVREAFGDTLSVAARRVDARLLRALDALDELGVDVRAAAARVGLSESRLTHLMTDSLGAPPRTWRAWLRLRRALGETMLTGATLTQAAHRVGFTDSAHLTRTSKQLMGVAPAGLLPRTLYVQR